MPENWFLNFGVLIADDGEEQLEIFSFSFHDELPVSKKVNVGLRCANRS